MIKIDYNCLLRSTVLIGYYIPLFTFYITVLWSCAWYSNLHYLDKHLFSRYCKETFYEPLVLEKNMRGEFYIPSKKRSKASVRFVIKSCKQCQSIDPAPVHWKRVKIGCGSQLEPVGNRYYPLCWWTLLNPHRLWTILIYNITVHSTPVFSQWDSSVGNCFLLVGSTKQNFNWQQHYLHLLELQKLAKRLRCATVVPMCLHPGWELSKALYKKQCTGTMRYPRTVFCLCQHWQTWCTNAILESRELMLSTHPNCRTNEECTRWGIVSGSWFQMVDPLQDSKWAIWSDSTVSRSW